MNMTQGQETGTKRLSRGAYQVAVPGTSCVLNVEPVGFVLFARILVLPELPLAHYVVWCCWRQHQVCATFFLCEHKPLSFAISSHMACIRHLTHSVVWCCVRACVTEILLHIVLQSILTIDDSFHATTVISMESIVHYYSHLSFGRLQASAFALIHTPPPCSLAHYVAWCCMEVCVNLSLDFCIDFTH